MTELVEKTTTCYRATAPIYVAADGCTVVGKEDKRVAFLKFGINAVITPAQHAALIFPDAGPVDAVPDAEQRASAELPDAEQRGGGKRRK